MRKSILTKEDKEKCFECSYCGEYSEIDLEHEYIKLKKENEKLRECVEYYADEEHLNSGYPMQLARITLEEMEK